MEKLRIIVGGYIGLYPTGGATWDYLQYPLGLKMLGHDVYYLEDTRQYPTFQTEGKAWNDASGCVSYLRGIMESFGMAERWSYRDIATNNYFGLSKQKVLGLCQTADVFINISCSTFLRDEYLKIPKRILIDSDPMFTQVQYALEVSGDNEATEWTTKYMLENHTHLFTFGENIGAADCKIPLLNNHWITTRQPICFALWENQQTGNHKAFTSIMNWSGRKKLWYNNEWWGQKDVEFEKYKTVPRSLPNAKFEVVVNKPLNKESLYDAGELTSLGWSIRNPHLTVATTTDYRNYILSSLAEFGVAKETYVKSNSGWFSCRSACYLAAGKPVVAEETGWSKFIPSGEGLFAFRDMDSAIDSVNQIKSNLARHSRKAKEIAAAYFDSNKVLTQILQQVN